VCVHFCVCGSFAVSSSKKLNLRFPALLIPRSRFCENFMRKTYSNFNYWFYRIRAKKKKIVFTPLCKNGQVYSWEGSKSNGTNSGCQAVETWYHCSPTCVGCRSLFDRLFDTPVVGSLVMPVVMLERLRS
jgi:hypothetical protein